MAGKAVQFGAGNIGRGFTAQLFSESGYEVVFVDVIDEIVDLINARGEYPIEIVGDVSETVVIRGVRAVNGRNTDAVAAEIADASLVCTAVGANVLKHIAPAIANGIKSRADAGLAEPLNIIICENLLHASDVLRSYILDNLPSEYAAYVRDNVGFVESVVSRMVPVMTPDRKKDPLLVVVEPYKKLPVDRKGFVGPVPHIVGLQPYDRFEAYVERKLFTHNLGHAAAAYLGYRVGHEYIWQAMRDPVVRPVVESALAETGEALIKRHGFTPEEHREHIEDLLHRFCNVALGDQVSRVARDPIRKLRPDDRLIGSGKLCLEYGVEPWNVCLVTAAALRYDHPEDSAAQDLQTTISREGLDKVFETVCGIPPDSVLANMIRRELSVLDSNGWRK